MKKILLAGSALLTVVSGSAMAADMRPARAPIYTKAPLMARTYNWSGCYIGANVGGLWARKDWSVAAPTAPAGAAITSQDLSNVLGGGQVGCNYQVSTWVFGIQADYDWTNATADTADLASRLPQTDHTNIKSLASLTGRVGYAWDRFLGYVKGGGAWERDDYSTTGATFSTASETRTGWTIGVGGEYAFTDWVTGFIEYDYYDFGTRTNAFAVAGGGTNFADIKETKSVAKVGINFKFNPGGPVAARY